MRVLVAICTDWRCAVSAALTLAAGMLMMLVLAWWAALVLAVAMSVWTCAQARWLIELHEDAS